jgi:hypothetical protein
MSMILFLSWNLLSKSLGAESIGNEAVSDHSHLAWLLPQNVNYLVAQIL